MHYLILLGVFFMNLCWADNQDKLKEDTQKTLEISQKIAKFYDMPEGLDFLEITDKLLASDLHDQSKKDLIKETGRRFFIFTYPSDGLLVKGFLSIVDPTGTQPLLVFLRGGNRFLAIPNPAGNLMFMGNYTVIGTTYRGGVSEGQDEFGGEDVNDVKNLIEFIPQLEEKIHFVLQNERQFLLGGSRGGMQMFLALARFPELQDKFQKVVCLSGMLDMRQTLLERQDMKEMFIEDFGYVEGDEAWINQRDPLLVAEKIKTDLPLLIIQGTDDIRVGLDHGYHMVEKLQAQGNNVTYWEIEGADHCLSNKEERTQLIQDWFES